MVNSYFKLVQTQNGYGLRIFPSKDGGERVKVNEVLEYLAFRDLKCDIPLLNKALNEEEETVISLGEGTCPKERETYFLRISEDNMTATVRFYPPSDTGEMMDEAEFLNDLAYRKIVHGIQSKTIKEYFSNRKFCTDFIVALGTAPRQGTDARIEYNFNTDLRAKPTLNEDGSVDFFHLNTINHCKEQDVLAKLIPEDIGDYGETILGNKIKPRDVQKVRLRGNQNTRLSEDMTILYAAVNGHVVLVEDQVFVSNVFQAENVDNSTGNIEYEGSVEIHGNVSSNFSVKAQGNIVVNGVVEGAYLEAGGDIVIARGINGMTKGVLKAGGNIVAKFIENASVTASGFVSTESILHSTVCAGDEVMVEGKKGFIVGGNVSATNMIKVKTLGSPMGATTLVEVGADPTIKLKYQENQKNILEAEKVLKSLEPIITTYALKRKKGMTLQQDQVKYLRSILQLREIKQQELEKLTSEKVEIESLLNMQSQASVLVTGEVFPGTKIAITDVSMVVQSNLQYCKFIKMNGDVKMVGI